MSMEHIAFLTEPGGPRVEVVVNFGVFAAREATPAELEELARQLQPLTGRVTLVSERRHELDDRSGTEVHQVRVLVSDELLPEEQDELEQLQELVLARTELWAQECVARRHAEVAD